MPELPEVETVRTGLSELLPGRVFSAVDSNWAKSFSASKKEISQFLVGAKVLAIRRRAKVIIIDLSSGYSLVIHLKMTGQLVFRSDKQKFGAGHPTDSLVGELPDKSTRVAFDIKDGSKLFFNDQRKFGWIKLVATSKIGEMEFFKKVGPEPLSDSFKSDDFIIRMRRRNNSGIKSVLMDQSVVAGVGNIYADESLFAAKIHPSTRVAKVTDAQLSTLYAQLRKILQLSIKKGGSTDRNYVDAKGNRGSYLKFAKVFRREGQTCPRCGATIIKTRVAGRGTHICPVCQVEVK